MYLGLSFICIRAPSVFVLGLIKAVGGMPRRTALSRLVAYSVRWVCVWAGCWAVALIEETLNRSVEFLEFHRIVNS